MEKHLNRTALLELASRVEREEPTYALRADIAHRLGWVLRQDGFWLAPNGGLYDTLPDWLHSLDAAASLMPPGWWWLVQNDGIALLKRLSVSHLLPGYTTARGHAPGRPAAALTAAALRAMAQEARDA